MTTGHLRNVTLNALSALCPVSVLVVTADGPVELAITGFSYAADKGTEKQASGDVEVLVSERLVLLAAEQPGGARSE